MQETLWWIWYLYADEPHMLENAPKTVKAKVKSFAVSIAISSAKSSHIFAGQKLWKSSVDKYRSFNSLVETIFKALKAELIWRTRWETSHY